MAEAIAVTERAGARPRCAVCHDESGALVTCAACATLWHHECRAALASCPTLGCQPLELPPSSRIARALERVDRALRSRSLPAALLTGAPSFALFLGLLAAIELASGPRPSGSLPLLQGLLFPVVAIHGLLVPFLLAASWTPPRHRGLAAAVLAIQVAFGVPLLAIFATCDESLRIAPVLTIAAFGLEPVLVPWLLSHRVCEAIDWRELEPSIFLGKRLT
jgi:hypothetical protein